MSAAPPGVDGAMMRIGRVGQSAALAGAAPATANISAIAKCFILMTSMMRALPIRRKRPPVLAARTCVKELQNT